jgi:hypothetical protein
MSKVADILNRYKALNEGDARDKEIGGKGSTSDKVGDGGDASLRGIIEKLVKENYGKDNKMQEKMCNEMMKLAKDESKMSNDFMEYMDEMASKYEMKDEMDEMDGSDNKGAKDADDEDEEEGDYKKTGKDSPDFGEKKGKKKK